MSEESFRKALKFTLKYEGGYVNDRDDPGGETKFGISKKAYPDVDIAGITLADASEIYYNDYWLSNGCDDVDEPLCVVHFDTSVNQGSRVARSFLENCNGDWDAYLTLRRKRYYALCDVKPTFKKYLKGWLNRVNDLDKYCTILQEENAQNGNL